MAPVAARFAIPIGDQRRAAGAFTMMARRGLQPFDLDVASPKSRPESSFELGGWRPVCDIIGGDN